MRSQKDGLLALLSACDTIEADRRLHDCGVKRSRVTELEDAQVRFPWVGAAWRANAGVRFLAETV